MQHSPLATYLHLYFGIYLHSNLHLGLYNGKTPESLHVRSYEPATGVCRHLTTMRFSIAESSLQIFRYIYTTAARHLHIHT